MYIGNLGFRIVFESCYIRASIQLCNMIIIDYSFISNNESR